MVARNSLIVPLLISLALHAVFIGAAELVGGGSPAGEKDRGSYRVQYRPPAPPPAATEGKAKKGPSAEAVSLETDDPRFRPYLQKVRARIGEKWEEPRLAAGDADKGSLAVEFTIGRKGVLLAVSVTRSSGVRGLDFAAVEAVKKAAPYDPFPQEMEGKEITVRALFVYD